MNMLCLTSLQDCRAALEDRIVSFGSVAGGIGIIFGILEVHDAFFLLIIPVLSL